MKKNRMQKCMAMLLAVVMLIGVLPIHTFAADENSVTNYTDFMVHLKALEVYADEYASMISGKDAGELVLNFIRTGVERYQDDNWNTLAGQENTGFKSYVEEQDAERGTNAMCLKNIVTQDFKLPNGNQVDFGHMFGCMNISYLAAGSADLSGWAGDLCDLLQYSVSLQNDDDLENDIDGYAESDVEKMAAYIREKCFGVDASGAYGWDDFYGDMDAYFFVTEYKKAGGERKFSAIMEEYFKGTLNDADGDGQLTDVDRTVYFMNNRFAVADSQEAVRKAIYESYSDDVAIGILEAKRGLSSYSLLRQACCYAFADYVYSQAKGRLIEGVPGGTGPTNGYYTVFSNEHSILAPGIEQDINYAQTVDGKQIVYYVATVDVTRKDVEILVNYNNNAAPQGNNIGLQSVADQVKALVKNNADKENFYPIVATNGAGYNITNGTPAGLVVMQGVEYYPVGAPGFFAILSDGSAVIGNQAKYEKLKEAGLVREAIQAFGSVLVKDGKINVTKSANYTANRASRTAVGITADGKVVMMVLDGRQLPRSAGGSLEEIAQIMLEAGCVDAVNLDGGGSTTYLAKPAGKDDIELVNVPSDGYERRVATSLVAVSTAAPSTAFDSAIISSDYEYITVGTTMQFNVKGVSNTGNAAVIPAGAKWQTSDASIGTINPQTGIFAAVATGEVTVQYVVEDKVVGTKVIYVVVPDNIKFAEDRMTAIYGQPKTIDVTVWYQGYPVAFTPLRDAFVFFDYEFDKFGNPNLYFTSDAGYINGLEFVGSDAKGIRTVTIYAALMIGKKIIATAATINLYYENEATFDFANATQGNRSFAWIREIENARTLDNQLYRISDPDSPIVIDYTFALDMTAIDFPPQLEPMKSMLPTYSENATAWDYLLQLAERVCIQTSVTIRAEFSQNLELDISELRILTEYFTPTSINLGADNVLTIVCNWVNQSQPIDPATANSLCILTGIKATVKDTAAYFDNKVAITNNGTVSYDIYLAASSLYSFASDTANQAKYGIYPYIHDEDCRSDFSNPEEGEDALENKDKGARFSSQYVDFADAYIINSEVLNGWHEEGKDYYYYVNNVPVTGTQLVADRHDSSQMRFYEFDETGKLVSEQGTTGLIAFDGELYYAVLGVAQTGWQIPDETTGDNYYFHPDTGKAVDGEYAIYEAANSWTTNWYTYTFENHILVLGDMVEETQSGVSGWRYRWAGAWATGWFDVGEQTYYAHPYAPFFLKTGYVRIVKRDAVSTNDNQYHLFNDRGELQKHTPMVYFDGANYDYIKEGMRVTTAGLYEANGYYYYVNNQTGHVYVNQIGFEVNSYWSHGLVDAGKYNFDQYGRLTNNLVGDIIQDKTSDENVVTTSVIGRVMSVQSGNACKVRCMVGGNYVWLTGQANPYAPIPIAVEGTMEYNFVIPKGATEVQIVLNGDLNLDGRVDIDDMKGMLEIVETGSQMTVEMNPEADVNGNGTINGADKILLALALLGLKDMPW